MKNYERNFQYAQEILKNVGLTMEQVRHLSISDLDIDIETYYDKDVVANLINVKNYGGDFANVKVNNDGRIKIFISYFHTIVRFYIG